LARSSPKKLPPRGPDGRFTKARPVKRRPAPAKRVPAQKRGLEPVVSPSRGKPRGEVRATSRKGSSRVPLAAGSKSRSAKPQWVARLEQVRLELRRSKRFAKSKQFRELTREQPVAKRSLADVQKRLTREAEKLSRKLGGPSESARESKRERDRRYQKNRRDLSKTLDTLFKKRMRVLPEDGIDSYLDEYDVSEHVFWVEFRRRYSK
jgi:uncharacterized membrane protein YccC